MTLLNELQQEYLKAKAPEIELQKKDAEEWIVGISEALMDAAKNGNTFIEWPRINTNDYLERWVIAQGLLILDEKDTLFVAPQISINHESPAESSQIQIYIPEPPQPYIFVKSLSEIVSEFREKRYSEPKRKLIDRVKNIFSIAKSKEEEEKKILAQKWEVEITAELLKSAEGGSLAIVRPYEKMNEYVIDWLEEGGFTVKQYPPEQGLAYKIWA